jgi:ABC-type transport system substrate-binding protein
VTAETVAYTIERNLSPKVSGGDTGLLANIVGAQAYAAGKASRLRGVRARGDRLTIRLVGPDPAFLWRLQYTTCVVPLGTPFDPHFNVLNLPAAGPYYVASQVPGQGADLVRNPNYRGSRPHRLDRINLTLGVSPQRSVAEIEAGTVDYAADGVPLSDAARLAVRYGPRSPAARRGRQQYFVDPKPEVDFLVLNPSATLLECAPQAGSQLRDRSARPRAHRWPVHPCELATNERLPSARHAGIQRGSHLPVHPGSAIGAEACGPG